MLSSHFSYNEKLKEKKKSLQDCNRYSKSIENMENDKSYTRRGNHYF